MAFELAKIDPTSVPINLLNPRPGTKFGDRDYMDPWEAVKWIAIFRLILPGALFRLCGGRVENLGDLQPLAVKAGLNGVMMGNFLTTLGSTPDEDQAMFTELGLNVARQPDNGANPRPDNRSGWLDGDLPAPEPGEAEPTPMELHIRMWDPGVAAALQAQDLGARPTRRVAEQLAKQSGLRRALHVTEIHERLQELKELGLYRRVRMISGPQGPRVVLDGKPVLLLCSNNYLGLADHPRVREAAADAAMRWGVGSGASRLVSGTMTVHRRLEERLADFKRTPAALLFGSGYLANIGVITRAGAARARSSSPTSSTTPRSSTAAAWRGRRRSSTATPTSSTSRGACARPRAAARWSSPTRSSRWTATSRRWPRSSSSPITTASASRSTRPTAPAAWARAGAARWPRPASRTRSTSSSAR